jgi:hypothetical protein
VVSGTLLAGVMPVLADALNDPKNASLRPQSCFAEVQRRMADGVVRSLHRALRTFVAERQRTKLPTAQHKLVEGFSKLQEEHTAAAAPTLSELPDELQVCGSECYQQHRA